MKFERGDLARAFEESQEAVRKYCTSNPAEAERFRVFEGEVLLWRGLSKEALDVLDTELPSSMAAEETAVRRKIVQGLANCFLQRFSEAQKYLGEAEDLAQHHQPALIGEVALGHGTLAITRKDDRTAEAAFRHALRVARDKRQPFLETSALGSLGLVYMRRGHYDESIDWFKAALALAQSLDFRMSAAKTMGNLGWCYFRIGDLENALILFKRAEELSIQLDSLKDQAVWLTSIGSVHYLQQDYAGAEECYRQGLAIYRQLNHGAGAAVCLGNMAGAALKTGKLDRAQQYNREALDLYRANKDRPGELHSLLTEGQISLQQGNLKRAEPLFSEVIRDSSQDVDLRWEAEAGLAQVYEVENLPAAAARQFRKSIETITEARSSLHREEFRLSFLSGAISFYDDYVNFLVARGRTTEALEVAELSRAHTLAEGLGIIPSTRSVPLGRFWSREAARRLGAVVLSYWLGPKHSYLWVVTPARRVVLFTLPPASAIEPLVRGYRGALVGPRDVLDTSNADGTRLYEILVAPATKLIPNGSRVIVIPDGSLYELNFETLLAVPPKLHYWIEDVTVVNASSLLLLLASSYRAPLASSKILLIGNPVAPSSEFPPLPQAEQEMAQVEKYFALEQRKVVSGRQATTAAYFESDPGQYSFIHFVAHGTASRLSPLDSAVILTGQGDSYKLYARDIIERGLRAQLVTISACNGAGARTYSGEGLVGLSWAFLRAGAHNVIAALWEVDDASTPRLMDQLYHEVSRHQDAAVALRKAKLSLLHSGTVYRKPFYWAPFQLYAGS